MSYYFSLPQFEQLTIEQKAVLNEIKPIALSGGPGTGKSVVCLWRHIRNCETPNKSSLLLTFTKTLEYYFKACLSRRVNSRNGCVARTKDCKSFSYDEIIIDEAQDVGPDIYSKLQSNYDVVSFSADDAQQLYSQACDLNKLNEIFPNCNSYTLHKNFRNSREILNFVRFALPNKFIPKLMLNDLKETRRKPILKECRGSNESQLDYIMGIIQAYTSDTHNIAILVPLADPVNEYYKKLKPRLDNLGISCSKYESKDERVTGIADVHITTFKSAKGTEFDTVIIPDFEHMKRIIGGYDVISDKDYYVGFTRAKLNLFLTCDNLPNIDDLKDSVEIET